MAAKGIPKGKTLPGVLPWLHSEGSMDEELTEDERALIDKHGDFYRSLISGKRKAVTPEQRNFIEAFSGRVAPKTAHELAFCKFARVVKAQRDTEWARNAKDKAAREGVVEDAPGQRRYPTRMDKTLDNARWWSSNDGL
jgi:uncharacterized protein YifE (UPF0438 family)